MYYFKSFMTRLLTQVGNRFCLTERTNIDCVLPSEGEEREKDNRNGSSDLGDWKERIQGS